jgi:hypothetical protein
LSKIDYYNEKLKSGNLKLKMNFVNSISEMRVDKLRTIFEGNLDEYIIVELNVNKVVRQLENDGETRYPIGELIVDQHTVGLIELIKAEENIIPPEIRCITQGLWKVIDGQHRISIMRYLKLKSAPFLVKKNNLSNCNELK